MGSLLFKVTAHDPLTFVVVAVLVVVAALAASYMPAQRPIIDVDVNFVGFEDIIVDYDCVGRLEAGMALDDRAVFQSSQPFLYSLV